MSDSLDPTGKIAWTAAELAEALGISTRYVWALNSSGRLPRPIRLGRAVRWNVSCVRAWINCGCPPRDQFEQRRAA
jgi:predicted DNA-binding transcriptional regulator AlpA